jgi:hypothetical protein
LSRDSQLNTHLESLVSSRPVSAEFDDLPADFDTVSGEEDDSQVVDEFYENIGDNIPGRGQLEACPDDFVHSTDRSLGIFS